MVWKIGSWNQIILPTTSPVSLPAVVFVDFLEMSCSSSCTVFLNCTNQKTSSDLERSTEKLKKYNTRHHQRPRKQRPHHHHLLDKNKVITKAAKGLRPWERWSFASFVDVVFIASNSLYIEHDKFFRSYLQLGVCGSPSFWRNTNGGNTWGISKVEPKHPFWNLKTNWKDGLGVWELQIASKLIIFSEMPVFRMVASRNWKVRGRTF